jgi:hypothetical protein
MKKRYFSSFIHFFACFFAFRRFILSDKQIFKKERKKKKFITHTHNKTGIFGLSYYYKQQLLTKLLCVTIVKKKLVLCYRLMFFLCCGAKRCTLSLQKADFPLVFLHCKPSLSFLLLNIVILNNGNIGLFLQKNKNDMIFF